INRTFECKANVEVIEWRDVREHRHGDETVACQFDDFEVWKRFQTVDGLDVGMDANIDITGEESIRSSRNIGHVNDLDIRTMGSTGLPIVRISLGGKANTRVPLLQNVASSTNAFVPVGTLCSGRRDCDVRVAQNVVKVDVCGLERQHDGTRSIC